jgi:ATP-dependent RNA helicase DeaD
VENAEPAVDGFETLGLSADIVGVLEELGYEEPTPVQGASIPPLLEGRDVMGSAATGTGKTAAFALPMIQGIERGDRAVQALILTPTRELAVQVAEAVHRYGKPRGVTVLPIYGGQPIARQLGGLKRGVQVVVGTPGRVLDHIRRGSLKLETVRYVVLDEADEMLDMGFIDDIETILDETPKTRQTALFSATFPPRIRQLVERHLTDPIRVAIRREQLESPLVTQTAYVVPRAHKLEALGRVLDLEAPTSAIVFCRTRNEVDQLTEALGIRGYRAEALHGGLAQHLRDRVMGRFREGVADLLVATDVAARGLDVEHVSHVVNYDIPQSPEVYVHRIGRTGRAGREGAAITLVEPREHRLLKGIERVVKQRITTQRIPTVADLKARRMELLRASLRETLLEDEFDSYRVGVESLAEQFDSMDIAAAALKLAAEATPGEEPDEMQDLPHWEPAAGGPRGGSQEGRGPRGRRDRAEAPARGGRGGSGATTRLYVGMGRRRGIRPADLVGAIAGEAKVPGRAVGSIEIADQFSIVEIPESMADHVIDALSRATIKGRKVAVRRARND